MNSDTCATALLERDFERLFIELLNWDRFSNRLTFSLSVPGQFRKRFFTLDERLRLTLTQQILLKGIAQLAGQVVFSFVMPTERSMPDYLRRCDIGRKVSRLYYEPIVVYSCRDESEQVWQFVSRVAGELQFFEHRTSTRAGAVVFAQKLSSLHFDMTERTRGISTVEVSRRLRQAFTYQRHKRVFDRTRQTAETFEEFGNGLPELAAIADEHRGLDRDEEATLFELARTGSESAKLQIFKSHLYIPLKIGLRTYKRKHLAGRVELADVVSDGIQGLLSAIRLYKPEQTPRFMSIASLWVQRTIDRELTVHIRPYAIPFYVESDFGPIIRKFDLTVDKLTQHLMRQPTSSEIQSCLGLSQQHWQTLQLLLDTTDCVRIDAWSSDELVGDELGCFYPAIFPQFLDREPLESILARLTRREIDVIRLRFGLDDGKTRTLEEVGATLGITRERARQIDLRASRKLRHIGNELLAQGFVYPSRDELNPDTSDHISQRSGRSCGTIYGYTYCDYAQIVPEPYSPPVHDADMPTKPVTITVVGDLGEVVELITKKAPKR
ncbi:MAG: sigma-70 family RNA polymerase sigma factor [Fimbriimonadaceae bacterium]